MGTREDAARHAITKAIRRCKKGRKVIAKELSDLTRVTVTEDQLYEFTRAWREDRGTQKFFPMEWIPALAKVTGSHELEQYALCEECQGDIAIGKVGRKAISGKLK